MPIPITRHEPTSINSKVVEANGFVFTSGIVAAGLPAAIEAQTEEVLAEIDRLLALSGTDRSRIVSATIWVADIRLREAMNTVWTAWTGGANLPARACIEAKLADPRMLVEIGVVAAK